MRCKQESVQLYQAEWLKFIERNLSTGNMGMRNINCDAICENDPYWVKNRKWDFYVIIICIP